MIGVLLAGGTGQRLRPLTRVFNKHLLPVGNVPMIYHSLYQFVKCGIKKVIIIVGREHAGQMAQQLDGEEFDLELTYRIQNASLGIAQALGLAKDFIEAGDGYTLDRDVMVLLADNIFVDSLLPIKKAFCLDRDHWAAIVTTKVENPWEYGVVEFNDKNAIVSIEEKPLEPKSDYIQTGCYFYHAHLWKAMASIEISNRGEYEISDVNQWYVDEGCMLAIPYEGRWFDAGTHETYQKANREIWG